MKVNGVPTGPENAKFGPKSFKRGDKYITFWAVPLWDYDDFNERCPLPENQYYRYTREGKEKDPEAPAYLELLEEYNRKRWGYLILRSLEPSPIEWDTVSLDDPSTWGNVEKELKSSLSFFEFQVVMQLVDEANALDERKLQENADTFFQQLQATNTNDRGLEEDPQSTSSTAPASDSM